MNINESAHRIWPVVLFSLTMLVFAAATNGVMDTLQFHYGQSVFQKLQSQQWWNPQLSWHNKWKNGDPKQGEAFPLSSTAFVALTDAWHLFKSLTIFCVLLAVLAPFTRLIRRPWPVWLLVLVGLKILYGAVFECFFGFLLVRS